jgi:hypothetical protein
MFLKALECLAVDVLASIISNRAVKTKSGEDFKVIFEYENLAAQGKEAIGIFATVLKINSALQPLRLTMIQLQRVR